MLKFFGRASKKEIILRAVPNRLGADYPSVLRVVSGLINLFDRLPAQSLKKQITLIGKSFGEGRQLQRSDRKVFQDSFISSEGERDFTKIYF